MMTAPAIMAVRIAFALVAAFCVFMSACNARVVGQGYRRFEHALLALVWLAMAGFGTWVAVLGRPR